jgi:gamma-glutamylcyclotransferase (GGCT)/AIG2-like uncharacterized protein YtfP
MLRIAVYGSLREGMGNHGLLSRGGAQKLSTEEVSLPFDMIDLGGFPGLIKSETVNKMVVEVYGVDNDTYKRVERLESYPSFYDKHTFETSQGTTEIYVLNQTGSRGSGWGYEHSSKVRMFDGAFDWVKHYTKKHEREVAD